MSDIKDMVGSIATGPAGFPLNYKYDGDANVDPNANTVEVSLDEQSLAQARAQNDGGINKSFAAQTMPKRVVGSALSSGAAQNAKTDNSYCDLFDKRGINNAMAQTPRSGGRRYYGQLKNQIETDLVAKNPLRRIQARRFLEVRKLFNETAKKKTVGINPHLRSKPVLEKMVEQALSQGAQETLLGPVAEAVKMVGLSRKAYKRWDGTLLPGSYPPSSPRPPSLQLG